MHSPVLTVPAPRVSGWVAETDPKYARAWLESLPLADSGESAREIYQALYTVNRLEVAAATRFELMSIYAPAVASVCAGLSPHLEYQSPPLAPKKRQLAEFVRRLHVEMAYGYKACLRDLQRTRLLIGRRARIVACLERAMYHLSEVLFRSYTVYMPYPPGTWREVHELYRLSEKAGVSEEGSGIEEERLPAAVPIRSRYVQTLLLGLANPYHLPQGMAYTVRTVLERWGDRAKLGRELKVSNPAAHFFIDLSADAPPMPLPKTIDRADPDEHRVLSTIELVNALHGSVHRLEKGESAENLDLGVECLDSACLDLLRRLVRAYGLGARRRHPRRSDQRTYAFVSAGVPALHFFAAGQNPFTPPDAPDADAPSAEIDREPAKSDGPAPKGTAPAGRYQVERWRVRDIGPQGISFSRYGEAKLSVRVGELVGVQHSNHLGRWQAGVIRWIRSPETSALEIGVELLGQSAIPVAVRRVSAQGVAETAYRPAVQLPAFESARRPPTLITERGLYTPGSDLEIAESDGIVRRVAVMRVLERTGSFDQIVPVDRPA